MYLSKSELFCKWSLFALLLFSIAAPAPIIIKTNLINTHYVFEAFLFFLLVAAGIQGLVAMIGWVMLNRDNRKGKKLIISTYLTTFAIYGAYSLYLAVTLFMPNAVIYPLEIYSIFALFHISAAVLQLQHFWTRYIF